MYTSSEAVPGTPHLVRSSSHNVEHHAWIRSAALMWVGRCNLLTDPRSWRFSNQWSLKKLAAGIAFKLEGLVE